MSAEPAPRRRITKGRIALAIALMPVLYVLNIGPLIFFNNRFGYPDGRLVSTVYDPFLVPIQGTALGRIVNAYTEWWSDLVFRDQ